MRQEAAKTDRIILCLRNIPSSWWRTWGRYIMRRIVSCMISLFAPRIVEKWKLTRLYWLLRVNTSRWTLWTSNFFYLYQVDQLLFPNFSGQMLQSVREERQLYSHNQCVQYRCTHSHGHNIDMNRAGILAWTSALHGHSKFLSQVFQVGFRCCKKQIWSTHWVDWEDNLKMKMTSKMKTI